MVDGVRITEKQGFAMAAILARRGASAAVIGEALAAELPLGPKWLASGPFIIIGSGPGTWLTQHEGVSEGTAASWVRDVQTRLAGIASVSDQTGAYRVFRVEGPGAQRLLQRGGAVDLDDSMFPPGAVAFTMIAYLDVLIRRLDMADSYELAVYRSSAASFVRWLDAAVGGL